MKGCTHQPTIEHHFATRESDAKCWRCGATTAARVSWGDADFPPPSIDQQLINAFREEHHHAD